MQCLLHVINELCFPSWAGSEQALVSLLRVSPWLGKYLHLREGEGTVLKKHEAQFQFVACKYCSYKIFKFLILRTELSEYYHDCYN